MSGTTGGVGSSTGTSTTGTGGTTGTGTGSSTDALSSLTSNYSTFLQLLMTQLQNQDPTSPMDTSAFTTELVQFSGVEQQIKANSSLSTLIQLQQGVQTQQATTMLHKQITAQSSQLALQGGSALIHYTASAPGPVSVVVSDSSGGQLYSATLTAKAGSNDWSWNGQNAAGTQLPDGAYSVAVVADNADGTSTTLPFTVTGTATGVSVQGNTVQLDLGSLPVNFSSITGVSG